MRITTIILIIAMFSIALRGNEVDSKAPISLIPPEAQSVIDKATADQAAIDSDASAKRVKVLTTMVDKLKTAQEKATKAGKLEASLAVRAEIAKAQGVLDDIEARKPKIAEPLTAAHVIGKYAMSNTAWNAGSVSLTVGGGAMTGNGTSGTWKLSQTGILCITWFNGNVNKGKFTTESMIMPGEGGAGFTLTRM